MGLGGFMRGALEVTGLVPWRIGMTFSLEQRGWKGMVSLPWRIRDPAPQKKRVRRGSHRVRAVLREARASGSSAGSRRARAVIAQRHPNPRPRQRNGRRKHRATMRVVAERFR